MSEFKSKSADYTKLSSRDNQYRNTISPNERGYASVQSPQFDSMIAAARAPVSPNDIRVAPRKPESGRFGQKALFAVGQAAFGAIVAETVQSFATKDHWAHPKLAEVTAAVVAASPPLAIGAIGVIAVGALAVAAGGGGGGGDCCFLGDPCSGTGGGCGDFDSSPSKWKRDCFLLAPLASIPGALVGESTAGGVIRNALVNAVDKLPDTVKSHASAETLQKLHQYLPLGTAPLAAATVAGTLVGGAALAHRWWNSSAGPKNSEHRDGTPLIDLRGHQPEYIV